jgi:Domain of unknown function (DUF397)
MDPVSCSQGKQPTSIPTRHSRSQFFVIPRTVGTSSCTVARMAEHPSNWRKSSWSHSDGNCVEVACSNQQVFVRDSKAVADNGPYLTFNATAWESFVKYIKGSEI